MGLKAHAPSDFFELLFWRQRNAPKGSWFPRSQKRDLGHPAIPHFTIEM
jgi:hypothetical protein